MTRRPRLLQGRVTACAGAFVALTTCIALAGEPAPGARGATVAPPPTPARVAAPLPSLAAPVPAFGLMAFLDPETGLLTGPIGQMVPALDTRSPNVLLEQVPVPGGGWMIDLKGTLLEYYVLHVDALGARRVSCVQDARRLAPPPPVPVPSRGEER